MSLGQVRLGQYQWVKSATSMPDYPKKDETDLGYSKKDKKDSGSPDYDKDYYDYGGGGNYYEYSGPDGTYDYDPYH